MVHVLHPAQETRVKVTEIHSTKHKTAFEIIMNDTEIQLKVNQYI